MKITLLSIINILNNFMLSENKIIYSVVIRHAMFLYLTYAMVNPLEKKSFSLECMGLLLFRVSCREWTEISASDTDKQPGQQIENTCGRNCEFVITEYKKCGLRSSRWQKMRGSACISIRSVWYKEVLLIFVISLL